MPEPRPLRSAPDAALAPEDRLDSWKEIAAYLRRDVTTAQRWEKREGMPVHRHQHDKLGSVFAFRSELDGWAVGRRLELPPAEGAIPPDPSGDGPAEAAAGAAIPRADAPSPPAGAVRRRPWRFTAAALAVAGAGVAIMAWPHRRAPQDDPLEGARFRPLTDFDGVEQAAAISRDGRFVAFQSDRDGRMDVWLTQIGSGRFVNLTRGAAAELVNPSVRTLGFSPDGTLVTYWVRRPPGDAGAPTIDTWAAPLLGGPARPYLEGVAEHDWSPDGARLVYHTPGPGDPTYVSDAGRAVGARRIFTAPEGLHAHFPVWSPDRAFVYFVQGTLPDRLDLWRIRPEGGAPERVTHHAARVSHPVFLDDRTLLYLATDPDGAGPWIHAVDVARPAPRRVSGGVEAYTSLSASADGRRLVATVASAKRTLWRVPLGPTGADLAAARRVPLTTGDGAAPRLGPGYLLYVSAAGAGDGLWRLERDVASQIWGAPGARIVGAPAIAPDGRRVALAARHDGRTALHVLGADGGGDRILTDALALEGSPAWAPDGRSVTVAATVDGAPRLFEVPVDGRPPSPLAASPALDPAWSPDGRFLVYSGADVGTTFPVRALDRDGRPRRLPELALTRGARRIRFLPGGSALVVLRGDLRHRDLWAIDLDGGAERPLAAFPADFEVRDFDVSPDGAELVVERAREHSDLALIELPQR